MRTLFALFLLLAPTVSIAQDTGSLDELWHDSCLWEVGSNTERVPAARQAMIAHADEALAYLIPSKLDTKDTLITRALSVVITGIKGSAAERLRAALNDKDPDIRRNAADLLGQLGDTASAEPIAALLDDPDTRGGALTALGALKSRASVPAIVVLLKRSDVQEKQRVLATSTLGDAGGADASKALVALLSDPAAQVRYAAQYSLEKIHDPSPLIPVALSNRDGHARLHAIAALGHIGDASAASSLLPLLRDSDPIVRGYAAEAIGALKRPEDASLLRELVAKETDAFAKGKMDAALASF